MILDRTTAPYTVAAEDTILEALRRISQNQARVVFVVDTHGTVKGALTDGDIRRWLVDQPAPDLTTSAITAANQNFTKVEEGTPAAEIDSLIRPGVDRIPVVDERGRIVAVAAPSSSTLTIGRHTIGAGHPALIIGEIGNNHQGDVELAKQLVDHCVSAGVSTVKFQLRDLESLYRSGGSSSHGEDLGPQYTMNLLAKYTLSVEDMFRVFDHCAARDVDVICTPWDLKSADALNEYGLVGYKIASADLTNDELLAHVADFHSPMIVSTGMSTEQEITGAVKILRENGAPYALLQTQSTYPAPFKDVNLRYMDRLAELGDCLVGYSGHERGWHVPVAAVARGASIIEKHVTVDKSLEGNDHKVSLLPDELAAMVREIRDVEEALGSAAPRELSTGELMNRVNLAKSLVAKRDLSAGDVITDEDIDIKSPGRGLQPNQRESLIGVTLHRDVPAGDFFYAGDLAEQAQGHKTYSFNRPWGLPVRFHDAKALLEVSEPDFLEFHHSYKDMDLDPAQFFSENEKIPGFFTAHAPDLYAGDFLINLASDDDEIFERSIKEVQKVIDLTRDMQKYFTVQEEPIVIVTMGGFLPDHHCTVPERMVMYERVQQGLERIDESGVRLTAQTLPPFPWLMGGQQFHNLFMEPDDTLWFYEKYGRRLTFDVSHSKLAANFFKTPFSEYVDKLVPISDHLHVVDSVGVDGEGVQVGEGEVDWKDFAERIDRLNPDAPFIPEIWMGHVNNGEGFFTALDRLQKWM